jgi:hypothetical protein
MLDTLYFLGMLAGIAWLAWWATAGEGAATPAPFDMREPPPPRTPAHPGQPRRSGWRQRRALPPQSGRPRR